MSRVVVAAEIIELLPDEKRHKSVLFLEGELRDEGLDCVSSLFVFDQLAEIGLNGLKDADSLTWVAYLE